MDRHLTNDSMVYLYLLPNDENFPLPFDIIEGPRTNCTAENSLSSKIIRFSPHAKAQQAAIKQLR
jgi:hypothetical protein